MAQPHAVPLSAQVIELLRQLHSLSNAGPFLFPAFHTTRRCMSENTLNSALRRLGYGGDEMTSHGFRAVASTLLNESGLWHPDAIERSLAHEDALRPFGDLRPVAFGKLCSRRSIRRCPFLSGYVEVEGVQLMHGTSSGQRV